MITSIFGNIFASNGTNWHEEIDWSGTMTDNWEDDNHQKKPLS